jgi:predicted MFS family arabinose efflux permease
MIDDTARQRAYWTTWVATLLFFVGFYALLVPLPRYLTAVGLPDWQVGLVLGAFGIASLIGRPIAGLAADRFGPRSVMLVGAASLLIGALGVPTTTSLLPLFGLRLLQAAGYVAFTTAGTALVVSLTHVQERGRRIAIFGAAANVAITLTPAAMSLLLTVVALQASFLAIAGLALVAGGLAATISAGPPIPAAAAVAGGWGFPRRLWVPMLVSGIFGAAFAAFFQFAPILAERRATIGAGALYTIYGVGIILTRVLGGRVIDRFSSARILAVAVVLHALGLGLAAVAADAILLACAALLIAVGAGLSHPVLIAQHAALLPEAPGRATAAFYIGFDLGLGLGSWIYGAALQYAGVGGLYGAAAALVLTALPLLRRAEAHPDG